MEHVGSKPSTRAQLTGYQQAWEMVTSQLRAEMSGGSYDSWVKPLTPLGYQDQVFTIGAHNTNDREWVEERLSPRITKLLSAVYREPVALKVSVTNGVHSEAATPSQPNAVQKAPPRSNQEELELDEEEAPASGRGTGKSTRKVMLQRAYGSERAGIIQPERGMFVTMYFFNNWLPRVGHSAFTVIMAARSMCYWNPLTGDLRNVIETEMAELAARAAVSVRTVKDVLNNDLVRRYFIRYKVRRMMTPNGVRTAGISLQVRMDDPLIPEDQEITGVDEEDWYFPEFGEEESGD
jgi:hypothetical protein